MIVTFPKNKYFFFSLYEIGLQEVVHVYLNKFENAVTHLY